ncbi:hypothetical protein Mjas_01545 [Methanothermococcus sp. Ax23]|uniref:hypothetical protein n=1 Tax=Methanothermococcus sp. Ax23 TaxID=3156486 RepID=UPI003BA095CC
MRKLILLLLSVFALCFVSAVSAEEYFVVVDGYSQDEIQSKLDSASWDIFTPQITRVEGNTIYFASEKDMARFLMPVKIRANPYNFLFNPNELVLSNEYSLVSIIQCDSSADEYFFSGAGEGTSYIGVGTDWADSDYVQIIQNDICKYSRGSDSLVVSSVLLSEGNFSVRASAYSGHFTNAVLLVPGTVKLLLDSYSGICYNVYHFRSYHDLTIYAEPGAQVYVDGDLVGTTDSEGKLIIEKPDGTYSVEVVFTNGITIEKTVEVTADGNNTVNFEYGAITFKIVDGLSGESLSDIGVSGNLTTTIDGEWTTNMPYGEYTLNFEKEGYWEEEKEIVVDGDKNITVYLFPKTSIFKITQTPAEITTSPNSVADVILKLTPVRDAYGTKLYITGGEIVKVEKDGVNVPKSADGSYILGDGKENEEAQVKITFKTSASVGEHQYTVRVVGTDILGNEYTTQKTIIYEVEELPFIIQQPSWSIGDNQLSITEQSGEDYSILMVLRDTNNTEIWSQSAAFNAYDSQSFTIPIPAPNNYVLEISAKNGAIITYIPISVLQPIKLLTPEVEGSKGSVATVKLEIKNPTNEVKYYDAKLIASIFGNETPTASIAVAPMETKELEVKFEVPSDLEFDSYELQVQVFEKDEAEPVFSDKVVLKIVESSFIPIGGSSGIPLWALVAGAILLVGGVGAYLIRRGD